MTNKKTQFPIIISDGDDREFENPSFSGAFPPGSFDGGAAGQEVRTLGHALRQSAPPDRLWLGDHKGWLHVLIKC